VLENVTLLHDGESRGKQGSEEHEPQEHPSCIGRHEPRR
jgi:hypothetical protein